MKEGIVLFIMFLVLLMGLVLSAPTLINSTGAQQQLGEVAQVSPTNQSAFTPVPFTPSGLDEYSIQIALRKSTRDPARDAIPILRIGSQEFLVRSGGGYLAGVAAVSVFALTPDQFATLANGDTVIFTHNSGAPPERFFGTLDKSQLVEGRLTLEEQLRPHRADLLNRVTAIRPTITHPNFGNALDAAIPPLTQSLVPTLWIDASRLKAQEGEQLFTADRTVIQQLGPLARNAARAESGGYGRLFLNDMLHVEHGIADFAIVDAVEMGGDAASIQQAIDEILAGYRAEVITEYESAADHYFRAWDLALKAVNKR